MTDAIAIVPVFNPEPGLVALCEGLLGEFAGVVVVDDGSVEDRERFGLLPPSRGGVRRRRRTALARGRAAGRGGRDRERRLRVRSEGLQVGRGAVQEPLRQRAHRLPRAAHLRLRDRGHPDRPQGLPAPDVPRAPRDPRRALRVRDAALRPAVRRRRGALPGADQDDLHREQPVVALPSGRRLVPRVQGAVRRRRTSFAGSFSRYWALVLLIAALSYVLTATLSALLDVRGAPVTVVKVAVESALFILSYRLQKKWVFG